MDDGQQTGRGPRASAALWPGDPLREPWLPDSSFTLHEVDLEESLGRLGTELGRGYPAHGGLEAARAAVRAAGRAGRGASVRLWTWRAPDGRLVGVALLRERPAPFPDSLVLEHLGVLTARRSGTGRVLMRDVAALAAHLDLALTLVAPADAEGFFRQLGMEPVEADGSPPMYRWPPTQCRAYAEGAAAAVPEAVPEAETAAAPPAPPPPRPWAGSPDPDCTWAHADAAGTAALIAALRAGQYGRDLALQTALNAAADLLDHAAPRMLGTWRRPDGRLLGLAVVRTQPGTLTLDWISSLSGEQGQGRRMMREVARVAAESRCELTLRALGGAAGFYERLGMHRVPGAEARYTWTPAECREFAAQAGWAPGGDRGPSRL